jgi:hypothetical protein
MSRSAVVSVCGNPCSPRWFVRMVRWAARGGIGRDNSPPLAAAIRPRRLPAARVLLLRFFLQSAKRPSETASIGLPVAGASWCEGDSRQLSDFKHYPQNHHGKRSRARICGSTAAVSDSAPCSMQASWTPLNLPSFRCCSEAASRCGAISASRPQNVAYAAGDARHHCGMDFSRPSASPVRRRSTGCGRGSRNTFQNCRAATP